MGKDEWISLILGAIGAVWLFVGLVFFMLLARWLKAICEMCPVEEGLTAVYFLSLGAIAAASVYFHTRPLLRSSRISGIILFVLQLVLIALLGQAIWKLLRGG